MLSVKKFSIETKNFIAAFLPFAICSVSVIFYCFYDFLLLTFCIPLLLCTIFANRKILDSIFLATILSFSIVCFVYLKNGYGDDLGYSITSLIVSGSLIVIFFKITHSYVSNQERQIQFIYNVMLKQDELIEKLKFEPLTKLYNRLPLHECLKKSVEGYNGQSVMHIVLLDLDHFKLINDSYGHSAGDEVLVRLGKIIIEKMGSNRQAFRFGGEEFVLVFFDLTLEQVKVIVEEIKDEFCNAKFDFSNKCHFTLSAGISAYKNNMTPAQWFDCADKALYCSKVKGRNSITVSGFNEAS